MVLRSGPSFDRVAAQVAAGLWRPQRRSARTVPTPGGEIMNASIQPLRFAAGGRMSFSPNCLAAEGAHSREDTVPERNAGIPVKTRLEELSMNQQNYPIGRWKTVLACALTLVCAAAAQERK